MCQINIYKNFKSITLKLPPVILETLTFSTLKLFEFKGQTYIHARATSWQRYSSLPKCFETTVPYNDKNSFLYRTLNQIK